MSEDTNTPIMAQDSARTDALSELLAEGTDRSPEEIERAAAEIEIEAPDDAESELLDGDWKDSPADQDYSSD